MSASHIRHNSGRPRFVSQKPPLSIVAGLILRDKKKPPPFRFGRRRVAPSRSEMACDSCASKRAKLG
jgi:hypothetical protein